jgi:hypothetical protein
MGLNQVYLSYVCIQNNTVMEKQSNSVKQMAMTNGLFLGLAMILNSVIFYVMGSPFAPASGYVAYALIIAATAWTMYTYREKDPEAGLTYGKALGLGTLNSLFASLILAFFTFVLFKLVDKTLIEKFLIFLEEQLLKSGAKDAQVDMLMPMYKKIMTPLTYSLSQIFSITLMGFIFSLIIAIFFKKEPKDPFHGIE